MMYILFFQVQKLDKKYCDMDYKKIPKLNPKEPNKYLNLGIIQLTTTTRTETLPICITTNTSNSK